MAFYFEVQTMQNIYLYVWKMCNHTITLILHCHKGYAGMYFKQS